jgi:periplasmic nitrate reductase NapD
MSGLLHIASLVLQHRPEAARDIDTALAQLSGIELALRDGGRSVLLCETDNEGELMDRIDALRALPGVLGVSLVHHHAEDRNTLMQELPE